MRAHVTGEAITALCGKKWVPTRDPSRYPVCPTCKELKDAGWVTRCPEHGGRVERPVD